MKKTSLLIGIVFLIVIRLSAQGHADNWIFSHFGLSFNGDSVEVQEYEVGDYGRSMGVISDEDGKLLFYSDGVNVFNKNKTLMPNGSNICVYDSMWFHRCIIIPQPESDSLYYVFSLEPGIYGLPDGLNYSIVDMSLDGGLGDVTLNGIKIQDSLSNKVTALYHENKRDIWLITNVIKTNRYNALLITKDGPSDQPVVSFGIKNNLTDFGGMLSATPDGSKIVCCYDNWTVQGGEGFDLFEFNSATGEMINPMSFNTEMRSVKSSEFSSDGTKLYIFQSGSTSEATLYQYDLSEYDYDKINSSRKIVLKPMWNGFREMQLAPNGKIYITKGGGAASSAAYFGVINYPNRIGLACDVVENGLWTGGLSTWWFTPNFIQNYFFRTDIEVSSLCQGDSTLFSITNTYQLDSVKWNFGDQTYSKEFVIKHCYTNAGSYKVNFIAYYPEKTDTISQMVNINPIPIFSLGSDTSLCINQEFILTPINIIAEGSYLWNNHATDSSFSVDTSGTYILQVTTPMGCQYTDDIHVDYMDLPFINLGNDTIIENESSVVLDAGTFGSTTYYLWDDNSTERYRTIYGEILTEGNHNFFVEVTASTGCVSTDTIVINKIENSHETLDSSWCKFYPNPSYQTFSILTDDISPKTILLYNSMGQLIHSEVMNSDNYNMDITGLADAVYFVRIYKNNDLKCRHKLLIRKVW